MGYVSILRHLLKHPEIGKLIVPIVPDEGRTFGMESIIRQVGIYASQGQLYKPHDQDMLLYYREAKDGQILEEGITEAGSMASFTAAGSAYSNYRVPMIPFFTFYSMFGFQRVGDLIWAFADARGKGFLVGGTAGRTTLAGEGLQHQDGHSIVLSSVVPTCATYDPAYVYEIAVIIQDGIRRMYQEREDRFYYITVYNEDYPMPEMPEGVREGILRGIYKLQARARRQGHGAAVRQRRHPERSAARAGHPGGEVRRAGRRVERHQLQRAAPRGARHRALEPPASRAAGEEALHSHRARRRQGPHHRRHRLHEDRSRPARALAARTGWNRWAPTASAAATIASTCAVTSRSMPNPSPPRPWRGSRATASSTSAAPSRPSPNWAWTRKKSTPPAPETVNFPNRRVPFVSPGLPRRC